MLQNDDEDDSPPIRFEVKSTKNEETIPDFRVL